MTRGRREASAKVKSAGSIQSPAVHMCTVSRISEAKSRSSRISSGVLSGEERKERSRWPLYMRRRRLDSSRRSSGSEGAERAAGFEDMELKQRNPTAPPAPKKALRVRLRMGSYVIRTGGHLTIHAAALVTAFFVRAVDQSIGIGKLYMENGNLFLRFGARFALPWYVCRQWAFLKLIAVA